jgi:tetratricopeptide (TPR) repeat protein
VALALALIAMLLLFVAARAALLNEWWLRRQSTDQLRTAADHDVKDPLIQYLYAERLVQAGATADAVTPAGRAVAALTNDTPSDLSGHIFALTDYLTAETGARADVEENLRRAATINPNDPFVLAGRGVLAGHAGHLCDAVDLLAQAARAAPDYPTIWAALGSAYLNGAVPDAAIDAFRRAVALAPEKPQYHSQLAAALGHSRRYEEAEAEYRRAADLAPSGSRFACLPAVGAAVAARTEPDFQKAVTMLQTVLNTRPGDPQLLAVLAGLDIRFARYGQARAALEASVASADGNSMAWYNLWMVCNRLGDRAAAARALDRTQRINEMLSAAAAEKQSEAIAAESGAPANAAEGGGQSPGASNPAAGGDRP